MLNKQLADPRLPQLGKKLLLTVIGPVGEGPGSLLSGITKKTVDIVAQILALAALVLLALGGISLVQQTIDTATVATGLNMAFVNGTLPVMAIAVIIMRLRTLLHTIRRPASAFLAKPKEF